MEANYPEQLQKAIRQTIAEIKGWHIDDDRNTGAIFFTNGDRQIWATPLYEGEKTIPIENEDGQQVAQIPFEPSGDLTKDIATYLELIEPYLETEYAIEIRETLATTVHVTAANVGEALEKVQEQYRNSDIILDAECFVGETIRAATKSGCRYAVILNFETGKIESLALDSKPESKSDEEYIEQDLNYSLSNCQWMVIEEEPEILNLNY